MIDIKMFRERPDLIKQGLIKRGIHEAKVDEIISLDQQRRKCLQEVENLLFQKNVQSKKVGSMSKEGLDIEPLREEIKQITLTIKNWEERENSFQQKISSLMMDLPNLPDETVPYGTKIEDNILVREWGKIPKFSFVPKKPLRSWGCKRND